MKTMKRIAMLASAALVLSACGGGGGGLAPAMPETPAAVPVVVAEPEREDEPEPVAAPAVVPEPLPDPGTLLQSHERLSLPDGFNAVLADQAMFLLANIPYREAAGGGGAGLAVSSLALQAGAYALYTAERSGAYEPDYAYIGQGGGETVAEVHPELKTQVGHHTGSNTECDTARRECSVPYPTFPGHGGDGHAYGGTLWVPAPIEDMPFIGEAMREGSEGVRTRGGVGLRYWSRRHSDMPMMRYQKDQRTDEIVSETWSGYGAWLEWSGFGLVMHARNHRWDLYDAAWFNPLSGGDLTGSRPSPEIEGTMHGAAVAMAEDMSFIADGDVEMTVRVGANQLDIRIGDWQGYRLTERGEIGFPTAVSLRDIDIDNMTIGDDGTFTRAVAFDRYVGIGPERHSIRGAFYGPVGGEAAGTFRMTNRNVIRNNEVVRAEVGTVIGAFGARKPDEPQ